MEERILSIESTTSCCSVAVSSSRRILEEITFNLRSDGVRRLASVIRDVMKDLSLSFGDLSAIGVSLGPGSFTGSRIGVATAKTISRANGLPLYGASSLLLLAYPLSMLAMDICPLLDAGRGEIYAAIYRFEGGGFVEKKAPMAVSTCLLRELLPAGALLVGEGSISFREAFGQKKAFSWPMAPLPLAFPRAASLGAMIHAGMLEGPVREVMELEPLYVRRPEAEVMWERRGGARK
jgi:tRNA threonylcarbamoyladenosine biosynthesis protein TsaB